MHTLRISEDIIPFAHFKAHASEFFKKLNTDKQSVVITQNGKPAGVLITPEDYDRFVLKQAFMDSVNAGIIDSDAQNVVSNDAVIAEFCS